MATWFDKIGKWFQDKVWDNFRKESRDNNEGMGRFLNGIDNLWNSLTGSGLTNAQREANKYSAAQAEAEYDREVEFYEKYQSPKAMMSQGVNPFGISGSIGGHIASGGAPQSVAPQQSGMNILDLVQSIVGMQMANKQYKLDAKRVDTEAKVAESTARMQNARALRDEIGAQFDGDIAQLNIASLAKQIEVADVSIEEKRAAISEVFARIQNLDADTAKKDQEFANLVAELANTEADTKYKMAMLGEVASRIANLDADTAVKHRQLAVMLKQIAQMEANIGLMATQAGLNRSMAVKVQQEWRTLVQEYDHDEIMNALTEITAERDSGEANGYYRALAEVKRFMNSMLGWFSGTANIQLPQRKPSRIGFK